MIRHSVWVCVWVSSGAVAAAMLPGPVVADVGGNRFAGCVSVAFQGGTFERMQQRCSGDFATAEQSKYIATLPGLPDRVINERLASINLTDAELRMAKEPGLTGRIWHGQSLLFDEGYGILMLLGILTDPKQATRAIFCVR